MKENLSIWKISIAYLDNFFAALPICLLELKNQSVWTLSITLWLIWIHTVRWKEFAPSWFLSCCWWGVFFRKKAIWTYVALCEKAIAPHNKCHTQAFLLQDLLIKKSVKYNLSDKVKQPFLRWEPLSINIKFGTVVILTRRIRKK